MRAVVSSSRLQSVALAAVCVGGVACGGGEEVEPDGVWDVTVSSLITETNGQGSINSDCIPEGSDVTVYSERFKYELYYDDDVVTMDIDGLSFGTGSRAGCNLTYESAIWLDDRPSGQISWYVEGQATYRGVAGGCDNQLDDSVDWSGYEVAIVVESEDETVPVGCEYELETSGTVVSGG